MSSVSMGLSRDPSDTRKRDQPFQLEPGFHAGFWLYGNTRLLEAKMAYVSIAVGRGTYTANQLDEIEREAESFVLSSQILVTGVHNAGHQRAAVVPLRWGSPRILILSGGVKWHLGPQLKQEPFRAARLWRYEFDPLTDLVISRRAPDKLPTFAHNNPCVDRTIVRLVDGDRLGVLSPLDSRRPFLG